MWAEWAEQQYGDVYRDGYVCILYQPPNCMRREEFTAQRVKAAGKGYIPKTKDEADDGKKKKNPS